MKEFELLKNKLMNKSEEFLCINFEYEDIKELSKILMSLKIINRFKAAPTEEFLFKSLKSNRVISLDREMYMYYTSKPHEWQDYEDHVIITPNIFKKMLKCSKIIELFD